MPENPELMTPVDTPEGFGETGRGDPGTMTVLVLAEVAPAPDPSRNRPTVKCLLRGDGANLITFTFAPGQDLPDHEAAHPITVQCISGTLDFGCGGETGRMTPGTVVHLPEHVVHRVMCPTDAPDRANVLLLTMLTGERHAAP